MELFRVLTFLVLNDVLVLHVDYHAFVAWLTVGKKYIN